MALSEGEGIDLIPSILHECSVHVRGHGREANPEPHAFSGIADTCAEIETLTNSLKRSLAIRAWRQEVLPG